MINSNLKRYRMIGWLCITNCIIFCSSAYLDRTLTNKENSLKKLIHQSCLLTKFEKKFTPDEIRKVFTAPSVKDSNIIKFIQDRATKNYITIHTIKRDNRLIKITFEALLDQDVYNFLVEINHNRLSPIYIALFYDAIQNRVMGKVHMNQDVSQ